MPSVTGEVTVQGLNELVQAMNDTALALGTQKNILAQSLRSAAEPIENRASELAPVYEGVIRIQKRRGKSYTLVPGKLKQSMMTVISEQTATGAVARIGPARGAFYGQWSEFGSAHESAKPFLRPAFDEKLDEAVAIFSYQMATKIEKELKKIA